MTFRANFLLCSEFMEVYTYMRVSDNSFGMTTNRKQDVYHLKAIMRTAEEHIDEIRSIARHRPSDEHYVIYLRECNGDGDGVFLEHLVDDESIMLEEPTEINVPSIWENLSKADKIERLLDCYRFGNITAEEFMEEMEEL